MTTLQKRRTPRSVLRARHGINFRFDESSIMASLAGMVALAKLPEHERERRYARIAAQLKPEREALDLQAKLARLDCDVSPPSSHRPTPRIKPRPTLEEVRRRYPRPTLDEVYSRVDYAADHTELGAPGVIVGLVADYNSVWEHYAGGSRRVFLPGAFDALSKRHRPVWINHRESLALVNERGRDTGIILFCSPIGLMAKVVLPATQLGWAVAKTTKLGRLGAFSIWYDTLESRTVDGVEEISKADVLEVTITGNPLAPLCRSVLVSSLGYVDPNDWHVRWLAEQTNV
jgi:phage head maturation protease